MSRRHHPVPSLAWSRFARDRHVRSGPRTWFDGSEEELLALVRARWADRRPGAGRTDLSQVVVVPVPPDRFVSSTVLVDERTWLHARLERRQPHEEPFVRVTAEGAREPARHASVVLYSAATLEENEGERSGDADWEVVCLIAAPVPDEPMNPVTMARNFLARPGGTPCEYSAREFAEAIWYWSRRASAHEDPTEPRPGR
ncbi:MAG: DUF3228 family protein [Candidatus Krumholzibacteriia bacterium]